MQHLQHFGLSQDPFRNEPDLRFFFESAGHVDAFRRLDRAVRQQKSLAVLTGSSGAGKTLLTRRLYETLEEEVFEAVLMVMLPGASDAHSVLTRLVRQLGESEPASERSALLAQLYEQLAIVREDGRHAVLIIDDAHILGVDAIAEIGGLLNLEYEDRGLLTLVLVGSAELEQRLQGESALHSRVDVRVRLAPLDLANTTAYLYHRLGIVGGKPNLIPPDAAQATLKFSRGRPRIINTLVDNALFEAFLVGRSCIEPGDIERAAADLAIGPDPGSTHTSLAPSVSPPPELEGAFDRPIPPPQAAAAEDVSLSPGYETATSDQGTVISSGTDLDALIAEHSASVVAAENRGNGDAELTTLLDADFETGAAAATMEPEMEALPSFEGSNEGSSAGAEATQIVLSEEPEAKREGEPVVQDLDDLFVELIEE